MIKKIKRRPIGVMDAGIGGLTVVKHMRKLYPSEDIIYFGDSANNPYGVLEKNEIIRLSRQVISYLKEQDVKAVAIACNTASVVENEIKEGFDFPILGIVQPSAKAIASLNLKKVGIFATPFTVKMQSYKKQIIKLAPDMEVFEKEAPTLGPLLNKGNFTDPAIEAQIKKEISILLKNAQLEHIVLACTHYPIVQHIFEKNFKNINFLDPAEYQAKAVYDCLTQMNDIEKDNNGKLFIVASSEPEVLVKTAMQLGLSDFEIKEHKWG